MISIDDTISQINALFLDTAPVIYFVENNPQYFHLVEPFYAALDKQLITAVTSPITLVECLYYPYRQKDRRLVQAFQSLLIHGPQTLFVPTSAPISDQAAQLRVAYNLRMADSLQIATAILAGCDSFLTNDKQLKRVSELKIVVVDELTR